MARSPFRGPEGAALKHELVRAGNIQQAQVFGRRSDKDQIIVLRVIEREQASALHPNLLMQLGENLIEIINRQDLTHSGVMVEDRLPRITLGLK